MPLCSKQNCDLCGSEPEHIYDAKTKSGQWGWLCPTCFKKVGIGIGPGIGQKFENKENGKKLEG